MGSKHGVDVALKHTHVHTVYQPLEVIIVCVFVIMDDFRVPSVELDT